MMSVLWMLLALAAAGGTTEPALVDADAAFARRWRHVSETSAVLYWQLPDIRTAARGWVEYGEDLTTPAATAPGPTPRWSQLHRLTRLQPGVSYQYRMVAVDPETGDTTRSAVDSFTTRRLDEAIRIPGDVEGPPYVLDQPGACYLLTEDVRADGSAFEIAADGVTLDLDGHTVLFGDDTAERVYGVRFAFGDSCRLLNGHIAQGRRSNTYSAAIASLDRPMATEVAGVSTDVHLKCAYPLHFTHCTGVEVHHNAFYSRVTEIENRHYPGNALLRFTVYDGDLHIHDNLLTEGCHWGITVRARSSTVRDIEIDHNDIRHHQQYVNGYAISPGSSADVHHNRITSTGRGVHLTGEGTLLHDNYIDTRGHQHLSDLPAGTRPFHHRLIELHGIKLEGRRSRNNRVYGNQVSITQLLPRDAGGIGEPRDKVDNGVYVRGRATQIAAAGLVDTTASWEPDRWRLYHVRYARDRPPVRLTGNDGTTLFGSFDEGVAPGEYTIYMRWEFVPPTPLNIASYSADAMNEIFGNTFTGITQYRQVRHGDYGDTGQWATAIMMIGMRRGASPPGTWPAWVHDNTFRSNDLFINSSGEASMDVRIEDNRFVLLDTPHAVARESRLRNLSPALLEAVIGGNNDFGEAGPATSAPGR